MKTILAISPHLDDAVFSAGGTLARRARENCRVVVATVFTASVAKPKGFALACQLDKGLPPDLDYMALRRGEDAAACAILGAEPVWLPFAEAPHRGYGSAAELFAPMRADDTIVAAIATALAELVERLAPDEILAPQAIGAHVDHVAVRHALRGLRPLPRLWADYPYVVRDADRPSPFVDPGAGETVTLGDRDLALKLDAVCAYTSQLGFQFGGRERARDSLSRSARCETFIQGAVDSAIRPPPGPVPCGPAPGPPDRTSAAARPGRRSAP